MEFQHSVGFRQNLLELMEEGKVLKQKVLRLMLLLQSLMVHFRRMHNLSVINDLSSMGGNESIASNTMCYSPMMAL